MLDRWQVRAGVTYPGDGGGLTGRHIQPRASTGLLIPEWAPDDVLAAVAEEVLNIAWGRR